MSIFIDPAKRFEIKLNCDEIKDEQGNILCYKIHSNGSSQIVCEAKGRSFNDMSNIIEEATIINSVTGNPLLRTSVLCKKVISTFFSSIKIINGEETQVFYPDPNSVNHMRYELVKALTKKWLEVTGGK